MIQRIQTLFILLAIAVNIVIFNFDLAAFTYSGNINNFTLLGLIDSNTGTYLYTNWLIAGLAIATILIGLLAIFLFKKRSLQIKITQLCLFFQTIFFGLKAYFFKIGISDFHYNSLIIRCYYRFHYYGKFMIYNLNYYII